MDLSTEATELATSLRVIVKITPPVPGAEHFSQKITRAAELLDKQAAAIAVLSAPVDQEMKAAAVAAFCAVYPEEMIRQTGAMTAALEAAHNLRVKRAEKT